MSNTVHRIYLIIMVIIVGLTLFVLTINGFQYYKTVIGERVYHSDHNILKPSGTLGHGLGIFGSLFIIVGISTYMARKRYRFLSRIGILKHWLEFHIFLCTLGPVMVLFHTAYKFGGLVSVSFWSMVAVFLSGIVGRFIYLQIPRSIEGRALNLSEVRAMKSDLTEIIKTSHNIGEENYRIIVDSVKNKTRIYHKSPIVRLIRNNTDDRRSIKEVKRALKNSNLPKTDYKKVVSLVKSDIKINRRIERLDLMQNLFKYWHVAHLPFAMVMLIIMVIHVGVTILFGYRWIF
jgi:hypothetical protein